MNADALAFLEALFAPCEQGFLTFTAMHPDGQHPTPSRHVPVTARAYLPDILERLTTANRAGWGAHVAVATRKTNLGRWRRGGKNDLVALPALFVDIDRPARDVLQELRDFPLPPSCLVGSGFGLHAYWMLISPTQDLCRAELILRGLAVVLRGDGMSPAQSLRLPGTLNLKPHRDPAWCELIEFHPDRRYTPDDFAHFAIRPRQTRPFQRPPACKTTGELNPRVIDALTGHFLAHGFKANGPWLNGPCVYPERHKHGDSHPSFGYNTATGFGFCHVCGTLRTKDLCCAIGLHPTDFGGLKEPICRTIPAQLRPFAQH